MKPTRLRRGSGRRWRGASVDVDGKPNEVGNSGRWERCVGIGATRNAEAMVALVLMDQALRHRAQCGDVGDVPPYVPGSVDG